MKGLILAAGRGSRMNALTRDIPKCLTPLAGRPLLDWQIDALRAGGVDAIGVVRGYLAHSIDRDGLELFDNPRWADTNMVQSLACAARWLREAPALVSYADIFYPSAAVAALREAPGEIAVAYDPDWRRLWSERFADPSTDAESFALDGTRVVDIGRRAASLDDIQGQYMGLLKFTPAGYRAVESYLESLLPDQADRLDMTSLLSALIARGHRIEAIRVDGVWGEVDSAADLAVYERWIAEGRLVVPATGVPATLS
jgi:L-glutamine-phosphate cytidylyltransferase